MRALFLAIVQRDLLLAARLGAGAGLGVFFFAMTVTLLPFGLGPDLPLLSRIGPGMIWIAATLASLLALDRLFQADYEDGSLDQLAIAPLPLELVVLAKAIAHWIATAVPLILVSPLLALFLNVPASSMPMLVLSLLVGTPALNLLGAVGAALTVSLRRGGLLLAVLVLPLYVPVVIFGVNAVAAVEAGQGMLNPGLLLGMGMSLFALGIAPLAGAAALRLHLG
ncbi:MAG: heme exporter protein CcmB [Alphaproteobacteria bacterium]|nr:heme exporter protein CcmB [Alphaproteobacteria bacterium]